MTRPRAGSVLLIATLIYLLFFHRLAERDLWGSHEARAAQHAARMVESGEWTLPRLADDQPDLQKPPMYYWLVAIVGKLRGEVDAWAVRLPAAASATLIVVAISAMLWQRGRPLAAVMAALFLITAQHFTWLARTARIDMPLALCVTTAALSVGLARRRQILGFAAIGMAVLLKGPIGAVLPLAILIADRWLESRWTRTPADWSTLSRGTLMAGCIALPWFLLADIRTNGEFFRVFFWYHNVQRASGVADELAVHPWWYYGPRFLVDVLPGSLILLPGMVLFVRGVRRRGHGDAAREDQGIDKLERSTRPPRPPHDTSWRNDREARFGLLWLMVVVGVLSFARFKRADYLLPAYPGFAIFAGCVAERVWHAASPSSRRGMVALGAGALVLVIGAWGYVLHVEHPRREPQREHRTFARAIREIAPRPTQVLLFRVECHPLAFHLGRPLNTFLEWENLDVWAGRPGPHFVLMSPEDAARWPGFVASGSLVEVCRNTDFSGGLHEKPLVLMRTQPRSDVVHAAPREQARDLGRPVEHGPAGAGGSVDAGRTGGPRVDRRPGETRSPLRTPADR